jgi:hypothetical protein
MRKGILEYTLIAFKLIVSPIKCPKLEVSLTWLPHHLPSLSPMAIAVQTSGGRNIYIFQYFDVYGYFMEYNTTQCIPILFLVEYSILRKSVFQGRSLFPWNS